MGNWRSALRKLIHRQRPDSDELMDLGFLMLFVPLLAVIGGFLLICAIALIIAAPIASIAVLWFVVAFALMVWGIVSDD